MTNTSIFVYALISFSIFLWINKFFCVFFLNRLMSIFEYFIILNVYFYNANNVLLNELCVSGNLVTKKGYRSTIILLVVCVLHFYSLGECRMMKCYYRGCSKSDFCVYFLFLSI